MTKKVLVLHPNDEQRVIKLQEEIGAVVREWLGACDDATDVKIFKQFPLWCDISELAGGFDVSEIEGGDASESDAGRVNKKIAGAITSVRIFRPEFSREENRIENVSATVEIALENKKVIKSKLVLSTFSDTIENKIDVAIPDFEMNVKIFRIGDATFEGNRYFITDGEWRKLKK